MNKVTTSVALVLGLGISALTQANERLPVSTQGQLYMQIQQLQQEVSSLRGLLEVQENRLQQLEQDSLQRYQTLDQRLTQGATSTLATTNSHEPPNAAATEPTPPAAAVQPGDPAREQEFYDAAFSLIRARDFDTAQQAFSGFLQRYPEGIYAANAHYWMGEIHLIKEALEPAGRSFATVIQTWPDHSKVPDSLYKLADVERRLGNTERTKVLLEQVVAQYPRSSAANLARQELQRM